MRLCRTLLCRVCGDDFPLAGSAYTYAYANAWRTVRLDYWMGSDARVRDGREYGFVRVVE